ncbi:DUF2332 family protein [Streptomyces canus]|uniref:DUF2332 family protein n=1 Tax=Streptomyces canus TaxID=58343 RepID=UPI00381A6CAA
MTIPAASLTDLRAMATSMAASAPVSSDLLLRVCDDIERRGPVARLIEDHPDTADPMFCVRLLAAVRWLDLSGLTPELAAHLRRFRLGTGDRADNDHTWHLFLQALREHPQQVGTALDRPVQQHQPHRAGALLAGLGLLAAPKVRLLELGACAGLNLHVDRYRWFGHDWQWGDRDSTVRLACTGASPGELEIVDRAGCDLTPRDPADPADVLILRSFLPPERDVELLELDDALALAARRGLRVDQADAAEWLDAKLAEPTGDRSVHTVVWHSLFWPYLGTRQQAVIERILSGAARRMPLARIALEPHTWSSPPRLQLTLYSAARTGR